tara:strand:+ start:1468 stop:1806 length:339 start_codon:yes stop_codon:yes gene_type:complete
MFRSLFFNKRNIALTRRFSDRKLPGVVWTEKFMSSEKIGTKSEFKEDNPDWKATTGDGKSIYDCENEPWCKPKEGEKLVRTYRKIHSDEHTGPSWVDVDISPEWIEPNLRED